DHVVIASRVVHSLDSASGFFGADLLFHEPLEGVEQPECLGQVLELHIVDNGAGITATVDAALHEISVQLSCGVGGPAAYVNPPNRLVGAVRSGRKRKIKRTCKTWIAAEFRIVDGQESVVEVSLPNSVACHHKIRKPVGQ